MASTDDELEILRIAFEESVRKLGLPSEAADTIRSRAGTVMATATAVAGFLGGLAFDRSPSRVLKNGLPTDSKTR